MENKFKNKIVIVTGGSRGIGRTIVQEFAMQGATVYFNYNRSESEAHRIIETLKNEHGIDQIFAIHCSVTDYQAIGDMIKAIKDKHGRIDILINNAGITKDNFLLMMSKDEWNSVIDTNLSGMYYFTKNTISTMMAQNQGVIVNIASVAAISGTAGHSNYAASKGGIIAFTKSAAVELAPKGIRVNSILPGYIETDMTRRMPRKLLKEKISQIPIGRIGFPDEIAKVASFLASDESSYIVGQSIVVDGGSTRGGSG